MILFDTAPIVAAAFTTEDHYPVCTELLTRLRRAGRRLLLPATVAAEAGYLLDRLGGPVREAGFLAGVADGGFEPVDLTLADYSRMTELVTRYEDLRLGTTAILMCRPLGPSGSGTAQTPKLAGPLTRRHWGAP